MFLYIENATIPEIFQGELKMRVFPKTTGRISEAPHPCNLALRFHRWDTKIRR